MKLPWPAYQKDLLHTDTLWFPHLAILGLSGDALIKLTADAPVIALDDTGNRVLDQTGKQIPDRTPPLLMSDALNRNQPSVIDTYIWCKCNAHARR